jgi:DNA invertase Pin-like site-specific DNA recombinase
MTAYIAYLRSSGRMQEGSDPSLEAQHAAIRAVLHPGDQLLATFTEADNSRARTPRQLLAAISECLTTGATLLIARFQGLARKPSVTSALCASDLLFVALDMPEANPLTIHALAAVAQLESQATGMRTRDGIRAARQLGRVFGGDRGRRPTASDAAIARAGQSALADERAKLALTAIKTAQSKGITSLSAIARSLQESGIPAPRGGAWTAKAVSRILTRTQAISQEKQ